MTIDHILVPLTVICAIGSGIVGGVFFAFSTFVMQALRRLRAGAATTAMQAINRAAPSAWFMLALLGTAVACLGLAIGTLLRLPDPAAAYRLVGAALYLVTIVVTIAYHIPRNNALDIEDPESDDVERIWSRFAAGWTAWNHVRTIASIGAATALVLAVRAG